MNEAKTLASFKELESKIKFEFKDKDLLREALTHRSYLNENPQWPVGHNERFEYLGDAVLELAVTEELFSRYPNFPEGQLTVIRAALVNYQILSHVASEFDLYKYLFMSRGEKTDNGRARDVILANAFEALVGAIHLDQGFEAAKNFIKKFVLVKTENIVQTESYKDPKSELQEIAQEKMKVTPSYRILEETGPAHDKVFTSGVYLGKKLVAKGTGPSKQDAEVEAASKALKIWGDKL